MYQYILSGGRYYNIDYPYPGFPKQLDGNAYVFGNLFELKDYQLVAKQNVNEHAQIGFLDVDLIKNFGHLYYAEQDPLFTLYGSEFEDDPEDRQMVRDYHPQVVWYGYAPYHSSLYQHLDSEGNIDSLIVDVNYLFHYEDQSDLQYDLLDEEFNKVTFIFLIEFENPLESGQYPSPSTMSEEDIEIMYDRIYDKIPRSRFLNDID